MKEQPLLSLRYADYDVLITDIFEENWMRGKEFSLYKRKPRPISALFFLCSDHTVTFIPQDGSVPLTAQRGDVVFIPKGSLYYAKIEKSEDVPADTYTLHLHFFDAERHELLLSDRIALLSRCRDSRFEPTLKRLRDALYHVEKTPMGNHRNTARVKSEFYLLTDLITATPLESEAFYYPIRRGVEAFCDEWNQNEKIEKYALMSEVSVTYFYRCFRKWSGKSPVEYRNMLRLSNAETLLRCTDMQIQEISRSVGFDDPFYFCRLFSATYGASPHLYRKQCRND